MILKFFDFCKHNCNYSQCTINAYKHDLAKFILYLNSNGVAGYDQITTANINGFVAEEMKSGLNARSVSRELAAIKTFCKFLFSQGVLPQKVGCYARKPKFTKPLPVVLNQEEVKSLLDANAYIKSYLNIQLYACIATLYYCGLRISELINLKIKDVDFERNIIRVYGKGAKWREVPICANLSVILQDYLCIRLAKKSMCDNFFIDKEGKQMHQRTISERITNRLKRVAPNKVVSPHVLRHTIATDLLRNGARLTTVQRLLGHTSIVTTQQYIGLTEQENNEDYLKAINL